MLAILVILFPFAVLFMFPHGGFTSDWYNSLYIAGYVGKYLQSHFDFPLVINAQTYLGNHFPVFYGYLLYPIWGFLSRFVGVHLSIRLLSMLVFALQFFLVQTLVSRFSGSKSWAFSIAALVTWFIYPLTNLYHRSAIPECLATVLLVCAAATWLLSLHETHRRQRWIYALIFALCASLMATIHAITGLYGVVWLSLLAAVTLPFHYKRCLPVASACATIFISIISPWIYLCLQYRTHLRIGSDLGRLVRHQGIDDLWIRFFPLPLDFRSVVGGVATPTSSLEAQISVPLLCCVIYLLYRAYNQRVWKTKEMGWGLLFFVLFLINTAISTVPGLEVHFANYISHFQLAYRLTTYSNFALLLTTLFLLRRVRVESTFGPILVFVLTLAGSGVLLKQLHASLILGEGERFQYETFLEESDAKFLSIPTSFYSYTNYEVSKKNQLPMEKLAANAVHVMLLPQESPRFGEVSKTTIEISKPTWIVTNVGAFPWNRLLINGLLVPENQLLGVKKTVPLGVQKIVVPNETLGVWLDKAGKYTVSYVHSPDPIFLKLRGWAMAVFLVIAASVPALALGHGSRNMTFRPEQSPA